MIIPRFVHLGCVYVTVPSGPPWPYQSIDQSLSMAQEDWVRYALNTYLIYTTRSNAEIFRSIDPYLGENGGALVVDIDLKDHYGRLPEWVWQWINQRTSGSHKLLSDIVNEYMKLENRSTES